MSSSASSNQILNVTTPAPRSHTYLSLLTSITRLTTPKFQRLLSTKPSSAPGPIFLYETDASGSCFTKFPRISTHGHQRPSPQPPRLHPTYPHRPSRVKFVVDTHRSAPPTNNLLSTPPFRPAYSRIHPQAPNLLSTHIGPHLAQHISPSLTAELRPILTHQVHCWHILLRSPHRISSVTHSATTHTYTRPSTSRSFLALFTRLPTQKTSPSPAPLQPAPPPALTHHFHY